jgi:hypothetical protein
MANYDPSGLAFSSNTTDTSLFWQMAYNALKERMRIAREYGLTEITLKVREMKNRQLPRRSILDAILKANKGLIGVTENLGHYAERALKSGKVLRGQFGEENRVYAPMEVVCLLFNAVDGKPVTGIEKVDFSMGTLFSLVFADALIADVPVTRQTIDLECKDFNYLEHEAKRLFEQGKIVSRPYVAEIPEPRAQGIINTRVLLA